MDRHALLLIGIISMSQHMYTAKKTTIIKAMTCSCNLMGESKESKESCTVEEMKARTYYPFEESRNFSEKVQNLVVQKWEPCLDKLYLNLTWLAPAGVSLLYVKKFIIELRFPRDLKPQRLRIPVNTTPSITSGMVNWSVTCQFDPRAYEIKQTMHVNVFPTPIPPQAREKFADAQITISKDIQENTENLEWKPTLIVGSSAKNLFQINFTVPEELRTTMTTFNISLEPSLGGPETSKTKDGRFTFTSKERAYPKTCYNITLSKVCNTCDGEFMDCVNNNTIKISKMWNGSNCSNAKSTEPSDPNSPKIQKNKHPKEKINLRSALTTMGIIIAAITLVGLLILIGYRRIQHKNEDVAIIAREPSKAEINDQIQNTANDLYQVQTRKTIFLIYSDDNGPHKQVVKAFATYLQAHCMCEVFLDVWDKVEMSRDVLTWHLKKVESADNIIMIHSEGGWHKAKKTSEDCTTENQPINGDRFSMMLPIVRNLKKRGKNDKFLMMRFSYTDPIFIINDLSFGINFVIPEHLEDLVLHIHDTQKYAFDTVKSMDNVKVENYHLEKEGTDLRVSITNAENYMKQRLHSSGVSHINANYIKCEEECTRPRLMASNPDLPSVNGDIVVDSGIFENSRQDFQCFAAT